MSKAVDSHLDVKTQEYKDSYDEAVNYVFTVPQDGVYYYNRDFHKLKRGEIITVSNEAFDKFAEILNTPLKPNENLKAAFKEYKNRLNNMRPEDGPPSN